MVLAIRSGFIIIGASTCVGPGSATGAAVTGAPIALGRRQQQQQQQQLGPFLLENC